MQSFKGFKCRALISATATMDDKEVTTWRGKTEVSEETRTEIISCVVLWMRGGAWRNQLVYFGFCD